MATRDDLARRSIVELVREVRGEEARMRSALPHISCAWAKHASVPKVPKGPSPLATWMRVLMVESRDVIASDSSAGGAHA